jgi:biopolymer transport protein ExbD
MNKLLKIFRLTWIRSVSFLLSFAFGCGIVYFSINSFQVEESAQKPNSTSLLPLNIKIYKRSPKEDCNRPDPLILLVRLDKNNRLTLNNEDHDLFSLENKLSEVFTSRKSSGVFDENGAQIVKTVFIQLEDSSVYNFVKIVDALDHAGANPIFIDPFNEYCKPLGAGGSGRRKLK